MVKMKDDRIPRVYVFVSFDKGEGYNEECRFVYKWVALNHAETLLNQAEKMGIKLTATVIDDNVT